MVGLLTALPKTKLHKRLEDNKRIIKESSANNTLFSTLNFIPKMDKKILFSGYTRILETIYNPKDYYERIKTFLREFKPAKKSVARRGIQKFEVRALFGSVWLLGIRGRGRKYFWNLLFWVTLKYPGLFHYAISHSLAGHTSKDCIPAINLVAEYTTMSTPKSIGFKIYGGYDRDMQGCFFLSFNNFICLFFNIGNF